MTQRSISGFLLFIVLPVLLCGIARGFAEMMQ
jgi:hypothetical protein